MALGTSKWVYEYIIEVLIRVFVIGFLAAVTYAVFLFVRGRMKAISWIDVNYSNPQECLDVLCDVYLDEGVRLSYAYITSLEGNGKKAPYDSWKNLDSIFIYPEKKAWPDGFKANGKISLRVDDFGKMINKIVPVKKIHLLRRIDGSFKREIHSAHPYLEGWVHKVLDDIDDNTKAPYIFSVTIDHDTSPDLPSQFNYSSLSLKNDYVVFGLQKLMPDREGITYGVPFEKLTHMLVVGISGSGKSVFQNVLLMSLFANWNRVERLYLADLKGGVEFFPYERLKDPKITVVGDVEEAYKAIHEVGVVMDENLNVLREEGRRKWTGRYVFFCIDEFAVLSLVKPYEREAKRKHYAAIAELNRISALGRAAGIRLIVGLQKATTDMMDSAFKNNLQSVVVFRVKSKMDITNALGSVDDLEEMDQNPTRYRPGRCIVWDDAKGDYVVLQVPFIDEETSVSEARLLINRSVELVPDLE